MELIKPGTNIDFVSYTRWALLLSGILIVLGLASFWYHGGPNYGVDFAGGTVIQVRFNQPTSISDMRQALATVNIANVTVQDLGQGENEFLIRMPESDSGGEDFSVQTRQALTAQFGEQSFEIRRIETVGPRVGQDLRRKALLALLFATLMIGGYIAFRFEPRFGVGAAAALAHDLLIAAGALSFMNMEFDLTVVAALLTVVGFSVNDTVIVCDRIRENLRKMRREMLAAVINRSINETLSRTVITTGTAVLVIVSLLILGGDVMHAFAFTLLIGIVIGTYSSVYIASPIVLLWARRDRRR